MKDKTVLPITELQEQQRAFVRERDWEKFHTPKNLATALCVEASELVEIFQWLSDAESQVIMQDAQKAARVQEEMADVLFFLLRMSDVLQIDLEEAFKNKMLKNASKYPADLVKGSAKKYTDY